MQQINHTNEMQLLTVDFQQKIIIQDLPPPPQFTFSVMTWNILADAYTSANYFPYAQLGYLQFEARLVKIKKYIQKKQPDILCLQEMDLKQKSNFFKFLEQLGYDCRYRNKDVQGIVIAFKKKLFKSKEQKIIDFDKFIDQKIQPKSIYMKGHGALILKLETLNMQNIIVATTHLFWDPKFERVKYHQICTAVESLKAIAQPNDIIILAGDFNSLPQSNVIQLIINNDKPEIQKCLDNNFKQMLEKYERCSKKLRTLKSAYDQKDGKYTNYTKDFKGIIDYIFYSQQTLDAIQRQKLPQQQKLKLETALPNKEFPSDHLPLLARFSIKNIKNGSKQS